MLPDSRYNVRQSPSSVRRDAWVEVSLTALEHNLSVIKNWLTPQTSVMAVVKSDAYGHGAPAAAELLVAAGAKYLGVASIDEGTQLRAAGIKAPVLILSPTPSWALDTALTSDLDISVSSLNQLKDVTARASYLETRARVHLKVDTGMHRLGLAPALVGDTLNQICNQKCLKLVSVFSHLAMADVREAVEEQNRAFEKIVDAAKGKCDAIFHLASSEATRHFDFTHYDMVRVGLYLYGLAPDTVSPDLRPALSVRARINHIGIVPSGDSVGYGWTWRAERDSRLASIPIGYADGVDRGLSNRIQAIVASTGQLVPQVGRISMDQMMFDVTDVPSAQEGDVLTLIGDGARAGKAGETSIYLSQWARSLDTITYELACRLRARLPRIYTRSRS